MGAGSKKSRITHEDHYSPMTGWERNRKSTRRAATQANTDTLQTQDGNEFLVPSALPLAPTAVPAQSSLATLVLNAEGLIENCNSACEAAFGYPSNELRGHPVHMLLPRLEGIELVDKGRINPRLRFLCRCAIPFLSKRRDGTTFVSEVFVNQLNNDGSIQIIVRPLGPSED